VAAALVTVGDELLAGDTEDANATWLADRLSDHGLSVRRIPAAVLQDITGHRRPQGGEPAGVRTGRPADDLTPVDRPTI
jgi:hypothetical protein